jgi:hypothetical protein
LVVIDTFYCWEQIAQIGRRFDSHERPNRPIPAGFNGHPVARAAAYLHKHPIAIDYIGNHKGPVYLVVVVNDIIRTASHESVLTRGQLARYDKRDHDPAAIEDGELARQQ